MERRIDYTEGDTIALESLVKVDGRLSHEVYLEWKKLYTSKGEGATGWQRPIPVSTLVRAPVSGPTDSARPDARKKSPEGYPSQYALRKLKL